jgi:hypothetical protein
MRRENEKMDLNELNSWLLTDEGAAWLESQKQPLINKRDELLSTIRNTNGKLVELDQRSAAAEKSLSEERAILSTVLVDKELASLLKSANVFETVIPGTVAELKERYAIRVKADGLNRIACGMVQGADGEGKETSLADIVSTWSKTPEAKKVILETNQGGGAPGSNSHRRTPQADSLGKLSGPALGRLSDKEFNDLRNNALNSAKG